MGIASFIETRKLKGMWKEIVKEVNWISKKNREYNQTKKMLYATHKKIKVSGSDQPHDFSSENMSKICFSQIALFQYAKQQIEHTRKFIDNARYKFGIPGHLNQYIKLTYDIMNFSENEINSLLDILKKEESLFEGNYKTEEFIKLFDMEREIYRKMKIEYIKAANNLNWITRMIKDNFQKNINTSDPFNMAAITWAVVMTGMMIMEIIKTFGGGSGTEPDIINIMIKSVEASLVVGAISTLRAIIRTELEAQLYYTQNIKKILI